MVQGTGSDVGKSLIVAALCRIAPPARGPGGTRSNPRTCPTTRRPAPEARSAAPQALQARAAGLAPEVDFNPVLLKPETDRRAQVVVQGKAVDSMEAADYMARRGSRMDAVLSSFSSDWQMHTN